MKSKIIFLLAISLFGFLGVQKASAVTQATSCSGAGGSCKTQSACLAEGKAPESKFASSCSSDQVCCIVPGTVNLAPTDSNSSKEGACEAGETCTDMIKEGGSWVSPPGMDCYWRNVCTLGNKKQERACCKPEGGSATAGDAANKSGAKTGTQTGAGGNTSSSTTSFTNPLEFKTVEGFLGGIMSAIQKIIVVLALTFMVFGGFMYVTAGANPDNAETGKKAIVSALVGLAITLAAPSLLKELGNVIGWGDVNGSSVGGALGISDIALRVLNFLLGTMGIVALVMMVIGATLYLTSAGDEDRIDQGKDIFKYSVIGIIMAMAAMILVKQVAQFFI